MSAYGLIAFRLSLPLLALLQLAATFALTRALALACARIGRSRRSFIPLGGRFGAGLTEPLWSLAAFQRTALVLLINTFVSRFCCRRMSCTFS